MKSSSSNNEVLSLVLLSTLWGLVLNGFFLYVPYLARNEVGSSLELIVSFSWFLLCCLAVSISRNYLKITRSKKLRLFWFALIAIVNAFGAIYFFEMKASWVWVFFSAAASTSIVFITNRLILFSTSGNLAQLSAWLGAAPLLGSLAISLVFYLTPLRDFYLIAISVVSLLVAIFALSGLAPAVEVGDQQEEKKVATSGLLQFGFLLGFAVAIVNTFVYLRLGELYQSTASEVAELGSLLIAIASLAGVVSSIAVSSRALRGVSRILLARIAPFLVAIGILVLLVAPNISWAGLAGVLVAVGFGLVNGLELSLVQIATTSLEQRIRLFGTYLAFSTVPYVFAGIAGMALIQQSTGTWPVFVAAFFAAIFSSALLRSPRQIS